MQRIDSLHDPRVAPFRNLRDRTLRGESIFVTEGAVLTRRLLASRYAAESLLMTEEFVAEFSRLAPHVPLYVAGQELLLEVVGFPFHRGVLGMGRRDAGLNLDRLFDGRDLREPFKMVVCPEITKPENMGLIFRSAGALGLHAVLLGQRCCDPFSRRCLRCSMGGVFDLPWVKSADLGADLARLKQHYGLELWASVLDDQACDLNRVTWPDRVGILIGNEFDGLRADSLALCDQRVTIPMRPGVDSLNMGVAAGIFMYLMTRDNASHA